MHVWIDRCMDGGIRYMHRCVFDGMGLHGGHLGWGLFPSAMPPHPLLFTIEHIGYQKCTNCSSSIRYMQQVRVWWSGLMGQDGGHLGWWHIRPSVLPYHLSFTIEHWAMYYSQLGCVVIHLNTHSLLSLIWRHIGYLVRWMSYWISNGVPVHLSFDFHRLQQQVRVCRDEAGRRPSWMTSLPVCRHAPSCPIPSNLI